MSKKILKYILYLIIIFIISFILLLSYLWLTEYKPNDKEELNIDGSSQKMLSIDNEYKIMTWNIGYGGLDKDTDFFMDGGKMVLPISKEHVEDALDGILQSIKDINADFNLIQEIDENSKRTYNINEVDTFRENLLGNSIFAYNYKVKYVPYPIPPMGKINSGIFTHSRFNIKQALRYQQPIPHKFPTRLANLKRGFAVSYIDIEGTDKRLANKNSKRGVG